MPTVNLHLGDSLAAMREMKDNQYSLAIVDPPYGIGADKVGLYIKKNRPNSAFLPRKHISKSWDVRPLAIYFEELTRVSKNQIICGANYFVGHLKPTMGWVFWDKKMGGSFSDGELIYTSFDQALRKFTCHPFEGTNAGKGRIHPTQKPVDLYRWLLKNYAKPGDTILDTHLGSGSIALACHDMGFDLDAWEIDPDYHKAACKRFEQHTRQQQLFPA